MGKGNLQPSATAPYHVRIGFLLHRQGKSGEAVPLLIQRGVLRVASVLHNEAPAVAGLMRKYANVPMSLADACLVRLSESIPHAAVFTLDSDFGIYRRRGRSVIPVLTPDSN